MKSKASAPGKVILFGEHFVVYGVKAILCAINKRVTVTAQRVSENKISITSNIGSLVLEPGRNISEINSPLKPLYYIADKMTKDSGIEIVVESEIPVGVGLGSSSACCVAGAAAVLGLDREASKEKILHMAIAAEKTIFENTSGADCTVCTYGGIIQYDKDNGFCKIDSKPKFHLVIANSQMEHSTETVVSGVKQFKEQDEARFSAMCEDESRLIEEVLELLGDNNIEKIGEKITQNQGYLETIGVSNEKIREMIKIGQDASFGTKITGAGGGGCIYALADESNVKQTLEQFGERKYDCFSAEIDYLGLDTF